MEKEHTSCETSSDGKLNEGIKKVINKGAGVCENIAKMESFEWTQK
jgi:hypothetical protein